MKLPQSFDPETSIYVAGHRGLVGGAIVRCLQAGGARNLLLRTHAELDLTDQHAVEAFFAEYTPQVVFLAAARVGGILANSTYPADFIYNNLTIQNNVLHQAYKHGVRRLLFLGSSCIYPKMAPQPIREESLLTGPLEPTNSAYAVAKIAGIEMCRAYNRQYGTSFVPVMPTNLYGPGDSFSLETSHVLPALLRKCHLARMIAQGDMEAVTRDEAVFGPVPDDVRRSLGLEGAAGRPEIVVWGTGTARREFLHVDDLAKACVHLVFKTDETELLNIGTGEDITIRELALLVRDVVGVDVPLVFDTEKPDGTPRKVLDVSRIKALGWEPSIGLREGVAAVYRWYMERLKS
ncbi:GDP-L-fucose synthase [Desulfovibrio mangrovi]|uniref:GDP-L-fucose synthase family protein n=1 Tax=Desulfovibrio mangrovi TaxID=2976983 RepID=UPI0022455FE9|nr:GDP-L-fucose synthase [Desulfovibrio mangrovi]UZP66890.1 GDP-L-fucose synthase [Desulfovibrio mangrovi]